MLQLVPQAVAQDAGPFTFPGARIIGVGDITQFIVKAHSTQTNNLVEIQANDGSQHVTITGLGETILDVTSTEALLVRKNAGGGDVVIVDTTNTRFGVGGTPTTLVEIFGIGGAVRISDLDTSRTTGEVGTWLEFWSTENSLPGGAAVVAQVVPVVENATGNAWGLALYTNAAGVGVTEQVRFRSTGEVGIGIVLPIAKLHIDQASATGAQPVLFLDQADVSEEMIEFATTIGVGNAIEAIGVKTLTTTHFIKVTIPGGLTRYFPVGTIA